MSENLSRWVGVDGSTALFARAIAEAKLEHPALSNVRYSRHSSVCLDGLAESAQIHGSRAAAEGVTAVLTALIELLGRLIGEDLAIRLVEQSVPAVARPDAPTTGGEDER